MRKNKSILQPMLLLALCLLLVGYIAFPAPSFDPLHTALSPGVTNVDKSVAATVQQADAQPLPEVTFSPVELIMQNPQLPNGCEVTSLAMVLTAAGFPADHTTLYETSMPSAPFSYSGPERFGPSPDEFYAGDASSVTGGWYCFEGPVVSAGNTWLANSGSALTMATLTGLSMEDLDSYAQGGTPLVVWVTMGYESPSYADYFTWLLPSGERYTPYDNLHCVVLAGEENGQYLIADPINGWQLIDKDVFWYSFDVMGRRGVTVSNQSSFPIPA